MGQSSTEHYRVLPGRTDDERLLLDVESADPVYIARTDLPGIDVGNRVLAEVTFSETTPIIETVTVVTQTEFRFVRTTEPIFEAAKTCFESARASGEAMNARVTHGTDGNPNGVVYTFAEQPGSRDLFAEFRDGETPLEPLVGRTVESEVIDPPVSVWVIDPTDPFIVVYIVFQPDGILADTLQETYQ